MGFVNLVTESALQKIRPQEVEPCRSNLQEICLCFSRLCWNRSSWQFDVHFWAKIGVEPFWKAQEPFRALFCLMADCPIEPSPTIRAVPVFPAPSGQFNLVLSSLRRCVTFLNDTAHALNRKRTTKTSTCRSWERQSLRTERLCSVLGQGSSSGS